MTARLPAAVLALAVLGASAGLAAAAAPKPVTGSVFGPVTSVKGQSFSVKTTVSPTGSSKVDVGASTVITEQVAGTTSDLRTGICVVANGQKAKNGTVTAVRLSVQPAVKGKCTTGFGGGARPGGTRPPGSGTRPPGTTTTQRPPGGFGNFGFAVGAITAVKGSTLTVHGQSGTTTVVVPAKAQITKTSHVGMDAITVKECASVFGTSTDKGVTIAAQQISLSKPVAGSCTRGFVRPG